jgi:catechol 2,3-dioxygenase-like lactoylglutathione lyase family enzyme
MPIELNHTIVESRDPDAGAAFLTEVLGLPAATHYGPFTVVEVAHGTNLDHMHVDDPHPQHYAFLVPDEEFDVIAERLRARDVPTFADPARRRPGQNTNDGGRGTYFDSPDGHVLEILTRPYGSGG